MRYNLTNAYFQAFLNYCISIKGYLIKFSSEGIQRLLKTRYFGKTATIEINWLKEINQH